MTNLIGLVSGVSTFVKVGWTCWLVWVVLQITWYRAVRVLPEVTEPAPDDRSAGWPPISATRHTTLLGASLWNPEPARDTVVATGEPVAVASLNIGWGQPASDAPPAPEDVPATRVVKKRRRAVAKRFDTEDGAVQY